jgi:hypothetical protein
MGSTVIKGSYIGENFYRAHLVLNLNEGLPEANPCVNSATGTASYMSIGAQDNRGNGQRVGVINTPSYFDPAIINFTAHLWDFVPTVKTGNKYLPALFFRLVLLSEWVDNRGSSVPRMILINLLHYNRDDGFVGPLRWNWPIKEAMYYPGAEVAVIDAERLNSECGVSVYRMSHLTDWRRDITYKINATQIFKCFSDKERFSNAMPFYDVPLRGVHWAVEGTGKNGGIWVSVHNMSMSVY